MRNTIVTLDPNRWLNVVLVLFDMCECSMTIDMTEKAMNFSSPVHRIQYVRKDISHLCDVQQSSPNGCICRLI